MMLEVVLGVMDMEVVVDEKDDKKVGCGIVKSNIEVKESRPFQHAP